MNTQLLIDSIVRHVTVLIAQLATSYGVRAPIANMETSENDVIGGSTYSFDVWPGHPMEEEVKGQLREIRRRCSDLRQRVDNHDHRVGLAERYQQIGFYAGQSLTERELGELEQVKGGDNE